MTEKHTPTAAAPWYDLPPKAYAESLRFYADRSERNADRVAAEGKPWSAGNAEYFRRQARRLRAMARLCDASTASRAGAVDFLGLQYPALSRDAENAAIAKAEGR